MKKTTKPTKLQKIQAEVRRRNKLFLNATPEQKRVLIAQDVIAQVKARKITAETGHWLRAEVKGLAWDEVAAMGDGGLQPWERGYAKSKKLGKKSLRTSLLDGTMTACKGCALGSMFISCTLFNNQSKLAALGSGGELGDLGFLIASKTPLSNGLDKFFDREQLIAIEIAFEGYYGYFRRMGRRGQNANYYVHNYPDDNNRLIVIMQNIIDNKGKFVPTTSDQG